jgi:hypothetical protein
MDIIKKALEALEANQGAIALIGVIIEMLSLLRKR